MIFVTGDGSNTFRIAFENTSTASKFEKSVLAFQKDMFLYKKESGGGIVQIGVKPDAFHLFVQKLNEVSKTNEFNDSEIMALFEEESASSPVISEDSTEYQEALAEARAANKILFETVKFPWGLDFESALLVQKATTENRDLPSILAAALRVAGDGERAVMLGETETLKTVLADLQATFDYFMDTSHGVDLQLLPLINKAIKGGNAIIEKSASSPITLAEMRKEIGDLMFAYSDLSGTPEYDQLQTVMNKVVYASHEGDLPWELKQAKAAIEKAAADLKTGVSQSSSPVIAQVSQIIAQNGQVPGTAGLEALQRQIKQSIQAVQFVAVLQNTGRIRTWLGPRDHSRTSYMDLSSGGILPLKNALQVIKRIEKEGKEAHGMLVALKGQKEVLIFGERVEPAEKTASSPIEENTKAVGGINLNPELLDLQIKRDGNGIPLPLNLQPIRQMHIDGFVPVIINITPVVNLPMLLGFADGESPIKSAHKNNQTSDFNLGLADKYREKYTREYTTSDDMDV
jgi:hypothetical protein